ncbi:MAG: twin-arginine translocation signal domain-containing protein [Patescibacteria group bacterium]
MDKDTVAETKPRGKMSRRDFLKLSGQAGLTALFAYLGIDSAIVNLGVFPRESGSLTEDFWNKTETSTLGISEEDTRRLKVGIENKFCVNIIDPAKQGTVNVGSYENSNEGAKAEVVEWQAPELVVLAENLMNLPPKMYKLGRDGQKVKFVMLRKSPNLNQNARGGTAAFCMCGGEDDSVVVGRVDFPLLGFGRTWTKSMMCHELTHKVVGDDNLDLAGLGVLLGIGDEAKLSKIFSIADSLGWPANLKYGSVNFNEFVAVGAEAYLFGKEKMCHLYLPYLGKEGALRFYVWLKLNVFDKFEYREGKIV